jgi:pimeloyl-ACP methyl ester carboxylesterase
MLPLLYAWLSYDPAEMNITFDDAGNGNVVVPLHGYPFDRSMWREQIEFLGANGFRAVAPDLRGLGETKATGEITSMADMARDVAALMDKLEIGRAVICGLSMGGYVAFEFAHLFPARVLGLVLAGTRAPADNEQERQAREQQALKILAEGLSGVAEATLPKLLAAKTLTEKPKVVERVREMILRSNPQGAAAAQRGMAARRDYSGDLPDINVPALIVVGREDPIRPVADAEFMRDRIRDSRLEIIEDAAHMTNMERPEVFNAALLRFTQVCAS